MLCVAPHSPIRSLVHTPTTQRTPVSSLVSALVLMLQCAATHACMRASSELMMLPPRRTSCAHKPLTHEGMDTGSDGRDDCRCIAGYTGPDGDACTACSPGTSKAAPGSAPCAQCLSGKYSQAAAASCSTCPSNSISPAGSDGLTDCGCNAGYTGDVSRSLSLSLYLSVCRARSLS